MEATSVQMFITPRGLRVTLERVTRNQVYSSTSATIDWYSLYKARVLDALMELHSQLEAGDAPESGDMGDVALW